ncbi:MAG: 50S ribosomal protein L18, partial [Clostridiales bacterium]|nr:50S ribosomal protein L18 [Clostridiales bacterium]
DDEKGVTLASCSTVAKDVDVKGKTKTEAAELIGENVAKKALSKGIETVVFDRGGYLYIGRVKALAEGARKAGLKF